MKILKLTAENIKRLSVVEITPDGSPCVVIAGENEAGKSSVLDAIEYALGGADVLPSKPIREGQTRGSSILDLGDYIVTRTFTPGGGSLVVTNRDGLKYPSPQALLDGLVGTLTFDPLAFAESDDKAQAETLRRLAGINTSDLDLERKRVFDERTLINRDVTQTQGALVKAVQHADVGLEPESATILAGQLDAADGLAERATALLYKANQAVSTRELAFTRANAAVAAVEKAQEALAEAEAASMEADEAFLQATTAASVAQTAATEAAAVVPDRSALRQQLAAIDATNSKVRDNVARQALADQLARKKAAADALTGRLEQIDADKAKQLADATFPVEGLGLDDAGVTWNGLPFSQASSAVRVRASVAIGLALNPKLKVLLVRNGNDLGAKNLRLLAEMATAADAQLWVERIAGGDGQTTIVIEDGAVAPPTVRRPVAVPASKKAVSV